MTTIVRCLEGHPFDLDAKPTCPRCGSTVWKDATRQATEKTARDADEANTARRAGLAEEYATKAERAREASELAEKVAGERIEAAERAKAGKDVYVKQSSDVQKISTTSGTWRSLGAFVGKLRFNRGALFVSVAVIVGLALLVYKAAPIFVTPLAPENEGKAGASPISDATPDAEVPETPLPILLASANAASGATNSHVCEACHATNKDGGIKIGPPLYGVVNRPKGAYPGYPYSDEMKAKGGIWTYADLFQFIKRPSAFLPGNNCAYSGQVDEKKRADILSFLQLQSDDHVPFPER